MDSATLNTLTQQALSDMTLGRQLEAEARDAISGEGIDSILRRLFDGVDAKLLTATRDVPNHLQASVGRYTRAMMRGTLNWEWDGEGDPPDKGAPLWLNTRGRDLLQDGCTDALITGKFAYFPYRNPDGLVRVTTLTGYLHPIYSAGEVSDPVAVLQVNSYTKGDKLLYSVRRYSAGLLEVWQDLEDPAKMLASAPESFPQAHAAGRLPLAFRVVTRNANRRPEGLAQTALPAFRRYLRFAVLTAFLATRGGFEERNLKSDAIFQLAKENPKHPLLAEAKKVGPNRMMVTDSGGSYERLDPVGLADYREQEKMAREELWDILNMPDLAGADLSGEALSEKRDAYTETVMSISGMQAEALTEVHDLLAALDGASYGLGWRVTHQPRFTRDASSERTALREDYKVGLPKSAWLSGLQSLGVGVVTEEHIKAAQLLEELELPPEVEAGK